MKKPPCHKGPDSGSRLVPGYLRCEYAIDPKGIDVRRPRLSWIVESEQRAQRQTAYRILVAHAGATLATNRGTLWDSGFVSSNETTNIIYEGKPLKSEMQCFWKVQVRDAGGDESAWSQPAHWTMGLLGDSDWRAAWIGMDRIGRPVKSGSGANNSDGALYLPPPRYLRKTFMLRKPIRRATAYASALGLFEMHINGRRVGMDYFTPGWTDYQTRVYYNTYDVTDMLTEGGNAMGAILADGWYAGYVGFKNIREHDGDKPRFRVQLHVEYKDGSRRTIVTDRSWKASTGPLLESDLLMGETHDARREMPGWNAPGFDDSNWSRVNLTSSIKAATGAYPGARVQEFRRIRPVSVTEPKQGRFVFDLGANFAGFVRLKVKGRRGRRIVMRFAERLEPDGTIYTENLRGARATDTYICKGGGREETWEPQFTFHGFQYVEVHGYPGQPDIRAITGVELTSNTPVAGDFKCSNRMANRLYRNIRQTQRANFIDIPTDCPQRDERLGWTGDAQIYIRTATCNNDVAAFFTKWLVDLADAQTADGGFPDIAPCKSHNGHGVSAWGDAGVICPWTMYQAYGDEHILRKHYRSMARWISFCRKNSRGLLRPAEGYGDWLNINANTPKDVLATAYFAHSADLVAQTATVLGKTGDAEKYCRLHEQIKDAFNQAYVLSNGRIRGDTQTVYVLALRFNLLPEALRAPAARHLVEDIESRGWHLSTGFVGTKDLMTVLTDTGHLDVAYHLFHNRSFPSWGFSIQHGATSIWERWDGWTPEKGFQTPGMNSFAHYSFGAVGEWMFRTIAGIDTDGPGFRNIIIRPRPGGVMKWCRASYKSIRGPIKTHWKIETGRFMLDVSIPANTTATIHIPTSDPGSIMEGGNLVDVSEDISHLWSGPRSGVYRIHPGEYAFESKIK